MCIYMYKSKAVTCHDRFTNHLLPAGSRHFSSFFSPRLLCCLLLTRLPLADRQRPTRRRFMCSVNGSPFEKKKLIEKESSKSVSVIMLFCRHSTVRNKS